MNKQYLDQGNLFSPRSRTEYTPEYRGDIDLSPELCGYIAQQASAGQAVKIQASLWSKQGQSGTYMKCKVSKPYQRQEQAGGHDEPVPF